MKRLGKIGRVGLLLVFALSMILIDRRNVFADDQEQGTEEYTEYCVVEGIYQNGDISEEDDGYATLPRYLSSSRNATLENVIYTGMLNHEADIDISAYHLTKAELKVVYKNVLNDHADLFFVSNSYYLSRNGSYVTELSPTYSMTKKAAESAMQYFNQEMDAILAQVNSNWSNLEKALFLQDYLCVNYEYATTNAVYDAYNFLKTKTGVCQAYAVTYNYLLKKVGIEGTFATSESMNHMWNIIKINGNWYHVDVTWNDPTADMLGRARHVYFLKSDTEMKKNNKHYGWTSDVTCTATTYDSAFWDSVDVPFVYQNSTWYYLDQTGKTINSCSINNGKKTATIYTITSTWYDLSKAGSYWPKAYSGLGGYDGKLYFNTPDGIYSYNLRTKAVQKVYTLTNTASQNLYGIYMNKSTLYYGAASSPNVQVKCSGTISIPSHKHSYDTGFVVVQATCQKTGTMRYTCKECGTMKTETIAMLDHSYQNATCTVCGKKCEDIFKDEGIEPDDSGVLHGVSENVTLQELESSINYDIHVLDAGNKEITDAGTLIGTGDTVQIMDQNKNLIAEYQVCIKGDTSGDGVIDVEDMEKIQKSLLKLEILDGVYYEAAALTEGTDTLSVLDMETVQKHILGIEKIK